MVPASPAARRSLSVSLRSVRSCSHLARLAGGWSSNAFRLTAAGAPCFLAALMATVRPLAVSRRKPIIVS